MATRGWGERVERKWGVTVNGYRVSFWGDENVLELDRHEDARGCECATMPLIILFKMVSFTLCEL